MSKRLKVKRVYTDSDSMLIIDFGNGVSLEATRVNASELGTDAAIEVRLNSNTTHRITVKPISTKSVVVSID